MSAIVCGFCRVSMVNTDDGPTTVWGLNGRRVEHGSSVWRCPLCSATAWLVDTSCESYAEECDSAGDVVAVDQ